VRGSGCDHVHRILPCIGEQLVGAKPTSDGNHSIPRLIAGCDKHFRVSDSSALQGLAGLFAVWPKLRSGCRLAVALSIYSPDLVDRYLRAIGSERRFGGGRAMMCKEGFVYVSVLRRRAIGWSE
jgi:hypothetical protein